MTNQDKIEKILQIKFKNEELLTEAFTHRSFLNEHRTEKLSSNERMEFLGDSVLQFWVSNRLYELFPFFPEGILTNMRTTLVRTETLADLSNQLSLGEFLLLSKGEEKSGGRTNKALMANTFEALLGAIFLDQGFPTASTFLKTCFEKLFSALKENQNLKDAKSLLQEKIQETVRFSPAYEVVSENGPDHDKTFAIVVKSEGKIIGQGKGKSKQEAEESAAKNALEKKFKMN